MKKQNCFACKTINDLTEKEILDNSFVCTKCKRMQGVDYHNLPLQPSDDGRETIAVPIPKDATNEDRPITFELRKCSDCSGFTRSESGICLSCQIKSDIAADSRERPGAWAMLQGITPTMEKVIEVAKQSNLQRAEDYHQFVNQLVSDSEDLSSIIATLKCNMREGQPLHGLQYRDDKSVHFNFYRAMKFLYEKIPCQTLQTSNACAQP